MQKFAKFVLSQFALLQEALVANRVRMHVVSSLIPGQSGYIRGVEDPHLLLWELLTKAIQHGRRICVVFADFKKAFPATWREDLLLLTYDTVKNIRGRIFALIADIFKENHISVWLSRRR